MDRTHESRARQLQLERQELEADLEKADDLLNLTQQALDKEREGKPLRDRCVFFQWLLHGDRAVHDRIRTHRRTLRKNRREHQSISSRRRALEAELHKTVAEGVEHDQAYRAIVSEKAQAAQTRKSCQGMLELVDSAHERISSALSAPHSNRRDEDSREKADQDALEVSATLRAVRKKAKDLDRKAQHRGLVAVSKAKNLDTSLSGRHKSIDARIRKYEQYQSLLHSVNEEVSTLLVDVTEQHAAAEKKRLAYLKNERAKFE